MTKKQRIEFIPLTIFLLAGLGTVFKTPFCTWIVALSGFFMGCLYFYGAFWLYAEYSLSLGVRIIAGLSFSASIITCMFCVLKWQGWHWFSIVSYLGLALVAIISLFNYKIPGYKQLLFRCIFFIIILSMMYGYKSLGP